MLRTNPPCAVPSQKSSHVPKVKANGRTRALPTSSQSSPAALPKAHSCWWLAQHTMEAT